MRVATLARVSPQTLKARLHLQFFLRFLVQFSLSDGCERVNKSWMFWVHVSLMYPPLNSHNSSTRSHPSEEENRSWNHGKNCKCKQAFMHSHRLWAGSHFNENIQSTVINFHATLVLVWLGQKKYICGFPVSSYKNVGRVGRFSLFF